MENLQKLAETLSNKYNSFVGQRREYPKTFCYGGENFSKTLVLVHPEDKETVESCYNCLETIANLPNAGSLSWEMRRYMKIAPEEYIKIFCDEIHEILKVNKNSIIDMNFYYGDIKMDKRDIKNVKDIKRNSFKTIYFYSKSRNFDDAKREEFQNRLKKLDKGLFNELQREEAGLV
jgi:hypothetical protein